ncbi:MAG: pantoate--beta-alanine ligase [Actinobacteria bacterium]|nr:pantoate--beta-alanine ligase [Actinomycetota bacterium]
MEVIREAAEMRRIVELARARGKTVGLVPTMGFFHRGHLELMRRAARECDEVVVTLFVNPTQFAPGEDLADYPRDFESDRSRAESAGVSYLFAPGPGEMYPEWFATAVEVEGLSSVMCGKERPGHFKGVATVVAKLFNIVPAQVAYFGQKDAQQLAIIRAMARDLDFGVEIRAVPTQREDDGLAMSSRNIYLEPDEREAATALFRSLAKARGLIESGERNASVIREAIGEVISAEPLVNLEYVSICGNIYLEPLSELSGEVLIALAAHVGKARLIDNMVFEMELEA